MKARIETDSMGSMSIPQEALWGASTQRAVLNFPISSLKLPKNFISALGIIKAAAAHANVSLGVLDPVRGEAIAHAAQEVADGSWYAHFVVDLFQTGSGTSTNMNANEVIANRALDRLGKDRGTRAFIHPNDHVNAGQSSNDVIPSALHISAYETLKVNCVPALRELYRALKRKSIEFSDVVKAGRTHLQDAVPVTLGQEFSGYAAQVEGACERIERASGSLLSLALGGTAVGTGISTHPHFAATAIEKISEKTGSPYREAENHFAAQGGALEAVVEVSGQLRCAAVSLLKIANDIRWLASGPRCSLGEISLPSVQPGSSIMPAKSNPVICESLMMVCGQVIGNDAAVAVCGQHGNFELNTMLPLAAYNLLQSIEILGTASKNFGERCVEGIQANRERCRELAERTLAIVTGLVPLVGYDQAAELAQEALDRDISLLAVLAERGLLKGGSLQSLLDPLSLSEVRAEDRR